MSSPPGNEQSVFTTSPGALMEPESLISRRKSTSGSAGEADAASRPRPSPTISRSYDPNDHDARERQRTMDEDMALQLSRARRETLSVPVAPHDATQTQPTIHESPSEQPAFPFALSSEEQRAIDFARGEHTTLDDAADDGALHIPRPPSPPSFLLPHVSAGHDPSLLVSAGQKHANSAGHPPSVFGLPSYQANVSSSNFDFSIMEEFAVVEKIQLGLGSPTVKFPVDPAAVTSSGTSFFSKLRRGADQPAAFSPLPPSGLSDANPYASPLPALPTRSNARQRKLSQSISSPRTHRKGIGGKMALFENMPGASSSAAPAMDPNAAAGATAEPRHGILNTGHDRPYRFSFYSNALSETIHARSLSELPADGQTFEELFTGISPSHKNDGSGWGSDPARDRPIVAPVPIPAPATSGGMSWTSSPGNLSVNGMNAVNSTSQIPPRNGNVHSNNGNGGNATKGVEHKTAVNNGGDVESKTWWLDVQSPTDEEMKMLSKVFSIHPLTTEDIQMEETREKIELFRHYYLVCFRSFDQDPYSPMHLEPLNMYIIVLREGTLSFHVLPTPHPQNVRRRIKQLKDYISVTSDWISYALIDDITDAFGPLIQGIEYEVDSIDELVLILKDTEQSDMLRRIGTCRKKVMGLLRLMGNKADVVKGLAKRCNENWRVAPTSDIGLYLSDIQDHLITMTQNLNHYEKILSRAHSNYLAQISIEMTDANNQINDVLSKLTALGTILIPMNLVTGLWGMNVHVPGQEKPGYAWFISIISVLAAFAVVGGYSTYRFMVRR